MQTSLVSRYAEAIVQRWFIEAGSVCFHAEHCVLSKNESSCPKSNFIEKDNYIYDENEHNHYTYYKNISHGKLV